MRSHTSRSRYLFRNPSREIVISPAISSYHAISASLRRVPRAPRPQPPRCTHASCPHIELESRDHTTPTPTARPPPLTPPHLSDNSMCRAAGGRAGGAGGLRRRRDAGLDQVRGGGARPDPEGAPPPLGLRTAKPRLTAHRTRDLLYPESRLSLVSDTDSTSICTRQIRNWRRRSPVPTPRVSRRPSPWRMRSPTRSGGAHGGGGVGGPGLGPAHAAPILHRASLPPPDPPSVSLGAGGRGRRSWWRPP